MSPIALVVDGVAGWLESRDDNTEVRPQNNRTRNGNDLFQSATNQTTSQQMFYNDLRFSAAKSIRTSTIILASFNIIAAFATAVGILLESYFREKRNNRQYKFWRNGFTFVPEGEVYPLILSVGIFIQSLVFAGVQSTGLDGLFGSGCTIMAQVMLPAVFLAPYIQLVFAVEIALRALRKEPFAPRGKWNVTICSAVIGLLVLAKFLVADFDRSPNFCLTSLLWFVAHYSTACFGLLTAIASILLICIVVIFVKLSRSIQIEVTARVTASRMVYYLALAVISIGFMLPYFYVMTFMNDRGQNNNALSLSMVAAVVANISGLMTGGLYLFLKSNTLSTIGPRDKAGEYENRRARYKIERRYTRDETDTDSIGTYGRQIIYPVTGPGSLRRMNSNSISMALEREGKVFDAQSTRPASTAYSRRAPGSLRSFRSMATSAFMPKAPERARISTAAGGHMRKQSYSLFPNNASAKSSLTLLPATTYSPNDHLKPPPSMCNFANFRHRRDSSLISSATVQIGLRLSSVEDTVVKNTIVAADPHVYNLDCPHVLKELEEKGILKRGGLTTPTKLETETKLVVEIPKRDPIKDARMKTLPPVPRLNTQSIVDAPAAEQDVTLSPSVYSQQSPTGLRLPSPRGVSFTVPPKSTSPWSPAIVPPLQLQRRGMGDTTPPPADPKDAWI